jgi:hypothetical protein
MEATIVIRHALVAAGCSSSTTAHALIVVSLTHFGATGDNDTSDFLQIVVPGLYFKIAVLDVSGFRRRHGQSCAQDRGCNQHQLPDRFALHEDLPEFSKQRGLADQMLSAVDANLGCALLQAASSTSRLLRIRSVGVDISRRWVPSAAVQESRLGDVTSALEARGTDSLAVPFQRIFQIAVR